MTRRTRLQIEHLDDRCLPSFSPATSFPVGTNPQAVVTADFNNDGHLDLATANPGLNSVSVLLGDGTGGFGAAIDSAGTTNDAFERASVTVADFNNDGQLDLATVMYGYYEYSTFGRLDVRLGNGDGTFQSPTLVRAGSPLAVAAGDFNNDGKSDLVVTSDFQGEQGFVQVLLGNGLGGFTTSGSGVGSNFDPVLAVGDLNGDDNLDAVAVAGEFGSDGAAFVGNGRGGLFAASTFSSTSYLPAWAVAVADFTRDGIPDLVVSGGAVEIFTGLGDGTFDEPIVHSANGYEHTGVAVADFNGDGQLDAVTSDADTGTVSALLGNGNGALTYTEAYAVGLSPSAIVVGDFNGDGRPDVATANAGSNTVSVLLNDGTWTPPPPALRIGDRTVMEGNTGTASATFTVTLSAPSTQPVTVAYSTGNGTAVAGSDYQAASGTLTFAPGETSKTVTVLVNGDRLGEPNETFFVNLSSPTNAIIVDGQGVGTITDDEPRISISDVSKKEGKKNQTTLFTFTVTLSAAYDQPVTMSFKTADGTAKTSDQDYVARTGTLTFAPGETTKTITIEVKGDSKKEADETFSLELYGVSSNALLTDWLGLGTILNDD
jgi:Calx-beta domain/FG-GAP-like repeat/FG-GAP repeat